MKLLSINVGHPQEVDYKGKTVSTGIFKRPVEGKVKVGRLSLEGDHQVDLTVHGGPDRAVYLYPTEHYRYWQSHYPDLNFSFGAFGENLSTVGLLESEVSIGDTYKVGTAEFMVTSPRMPCYKLGIKMGDPLFVKAFLKANYNGFYMKVLTEGSIEAPSLIEKTGSDGFGLKVDEVSRLYALDKNNEELLEKAVGAPNLPHDWKEFYEKRLNSLSERS